MSITAQCRVNKFEKYFIWYLIIHSQIYFMTDINNYSLSRNELITKKYGFTDHLYHPEAISPPE